MRHGAPYEQCYYCRKWVKLSGLFAGIHICLDEDERRSVDERDRASLARQAQIAQQVQMRHSRRGKVTE